MGTFNEAAASKDCSTPNESFEEFEAMLTRMGPCRTGPLSKFPSFEVQWAVAGGFWGMYVDTWLRGISASSRDRFGS